MRWRNVLVVVACVSCSHGSGGGQSSGVHAIPGCGVTSEKDAGLSEAAQGWQKAVDAKDVNGLLSYFDDEATAFYPRPQPSLGKERIRRDWADFFSRKNAAHPVTIEKVSTSVCGDFGYVIRRVRASWTDDSGGDQSFQGMMVEVWQKKSGQWRIVTQSGNVYDMSTSP